MACLCTGVPVKVGLGLLLPNGSDHRMIACYLGLYEEDDGVRPGFLELQLVGH